MTGRPRPQPAQDDSTEATAPRAPEAGAHDVDDEVDVPTAAATIRAHLQTLAGVRGRTLLVFAVTATALAVRLGPVPELPAYLYLALVGVALGRVDLAHNRLPNVLTLPAYPSTVLLLAAAAAAETNLTNLGRAAAAGAAAWLTFAVIRLAYPPGLGYGDVKLAGILGMAAGWLGWNTAGLALIAAYGAGALASIALLLARRAGRRTQIPFGPYMLAGTLLAVLLTA